MAFTVRSKLPGTMRTASWRSAVEPSRLNESIHTPSSLKRRMTSRVSNGVPAGVTATKKPIATARRSHGNRSGCLSGSPPVNTMCGLGSNSASCSSSRYPSSVRNSCG